jgi:hypothetical protein
MSIQRYFKRLQYIDFLVSKKSTGSLENFAQKNHLSKSGLILLLNEMREMGFPISFSRKQNTYFYSKPGELVKSLFIENDQLLSREELSKLSCENLDNLCYSDISIFEKCKNS